MTTRWFMDAYGVAHVIVEAPWGTPVRSMRDAGRARMRQELAARQSGRPVFRLRRVDDAGRHLGGCKRVEWSE